MLSACHYEQDEVRYGKTGRDFREYISGITVAVNDVKCGEKIMTLIIKKNEAEMNENVAKGLLYIWGIVLLVVLLCWGKIFNIAFDMTVILLTIASITLVVPAVVVLKLHFYNDMMKYLIVTSTAIMAATSYALFTFQAVIVFVVPTIIAGFYINRRLLCYSGVVSVIAIIMAHIITGVYLCQPWIEPFTGMWEILRYGAIPRCLQYSGCFLLLFLMMKRYMDVIPHAAYAKEDLACDADKKTMEEKEFEIILQKLTERERSVFVLMVKGYTNMQIADKLCLSVGTVKNYISTIYEKIGSKERNALIMKYNRLAE